MATAALVAAGLAIAFWLPARNDTASANENGQRASSGQHRDSRHHHRDRDRDRDRDRESASPSPSVSETAPSEPPTSPSTSPSPSSEPSETTPPETTPPTTEPTAPPTTEPTTAPPTTEPPAPAAKPWAEFTDYAAGDQVTFGGKTYEVLSAHTSLPGWEPTALPALFKLVS